MTGARKRVAALVAGTSRQHEPTGEPLVGTLDAGRAAEFQLTLRGTFCYIVAGAGEDVEFRRDADFAQAGVETLALHERDLVVFVAVEDEEGRIVGCDVVEWADLAGEVGAVVVSGA